MAAPPDPFQDRVAVVTGGASGIGLAMARAFGARGAKLALADIDEAALATARAEFEAAGTPVLTVRTDVSERKSVADLADSVFRHYGGAHIVCNNAGIADLGPIVEVTPEQWDLSMGINFWGVVHGVDAFVPRLVAQKQGGHVVNTASMAGLVGMPNFAVYCASKFAVVGLTESIARELAPHDIGASLLCPMIVATNIGSNTARALGRPAPVAPPPEPPPEGAPAPAGMVGSVIRTERVAAAVVRGIERKSLYILTHPEQREILARRAARLDAVFADPL